jgi:hypothetical protein
MQDPREGSPRQTPMRAQRRQASPASAGSRPRFSPARASPPDIDDSYVCQAVVFRVSVCPRCECVRDRPTARSFAVHDLAGTAPERRDPRRLSRLPGYGRAAACRSMWASPEAGQAGREGPAEAICAGPARRGGHHDRRAACSRPGRALDRATPPRSSVVVPALPAIDFQLPDPGPQRLRMNTGDEQAEIAPAGLMLTLKWVMTAPNGRSMLAM